MKKFISLSLAIILLIFTIPIFAEHESSADSLNKLGLFNGTDNGYDLDSTFTRAQGATMLVRLLGRENEIDQWNAGTVFSDVEADNWANPYISYCYANGIVNGTSETTFTPEREMTCEEYLTIILRAIGYSNVNPDNACIAAAEYGLLTSKTLNDIAEKETFIRDDMVYISYNALTIKGADGKTIAENLLSKVIITEGQYKEDVSSAVQTIDDILSEF